MRQIKTETWKRTEILDLLDDLLELGIAFHMFNNNLAFVCSDDLFKELQR